MNTTLQSAGFRRRRGGLAAALAITCGACGADPSSQEAGGAQGEPERAAPAAQRDSSTQAPLSRREIKRGTERRRAERAALQIPAERIEALKPELGLGDGDELRPAGAEPYRDGCGSVRLTHYHAGLRVIGSGAIVHTDDQGATSRVTSALRPDVRVSTTPTLDAAQAVEAVKADPERRAYRSEPEVELAILPVEEQVVKATGAPLRAEDQARAAAELDRRIVEHRLVYVVETDEEDPLAAAPLRSMRYLVDAHTGEILRQRSLISRDAAVNEGVSMYRYPDSSTTFSSQVSLDTSLDAPWFDPFVDRYVMYDEGRNFEVQDDDYSWWYGSNNLYIGAGAWGDGMPFAGDSGASTKHRQTSMVDANFALQATWTMFDRVFQRQGPDDDYYDANCKVHYGTWWNDAEYNPLYGNIYVGDGPESGGGTRTSLDTIAHEWGHAFDDFTADLRECNNGEACGLSEANADIIAVMANYYVYNRGLFQDLTTIPDGTHSVNTGAHSINYWRLFNSRSFANPVFPYYFSGIGSEDEHDALGPMVAAFFFMARGASANTSSSGFSYLLPFGSDGIGIHSAARIWYHAMTNHLTDTTTYATVDDALIQAAKCVFGDTSPEQPEVTATRLSLAAANITGVPGSYTMPPTFFEYEPNEDQTEVNWVPKPADSTAPAGKPIRKEVFGSAGTDQVDWFQVWVPNGYALKVSLLPTMGNDHDLFVIESGAASGIMSFNSGFAADVISEPYVVGAPSGHKTYNVRVTGFSSGANGAYHLYFDWVPACSSEADSQQPFASNMAGCAGSVTWADRASLCNEGYHVCTAQEWVSRRNGAVPGHNYWTNDDLKYSGSGSGNCSASVTTGSSCGANPMRVCSPTQADPEGNNCNWTSCGLDSTTSTYFGGCAGNTSAGTLCCSN